MQAVHTVKHTYITQLGCDVSGCQHKVCHTDQIQSLGWDPCIQYTKSTQQEVNTAGDYLALANFDHTQM